MTLEEYAAAWDAGRAHTADQASTARIKELEAALKLAEVALASYSTTHVGVHHHALERVRAALANAAPQAQALAAEIHMLTGER